MKRDPGKTKTPLAERALLGAGAGLSLFAFVAAALLAAQRAGLIMGLARSGRYDRFLALSLDALPFGLVALGLLASVWTLVAFRRPAARRSLAFLLLCVVAAGAWSMRSEGSNLSILSRRAWSGRERRHFLSG